MLSGYSENRAKARSKPLSLPAPPPLSSSELTSLASSTYKQHPPAIYGGDALALLEGYANRQIASLESCESFLFLYELFCGAIDVCVVRSESDSRAKFVEFVMHVLVSDSVWKSNTWALSLFRLFLHSPHICETLPSTRFLLDNLGIVEEQHKAKKGWGLRSFVWGSQNSELIEQSKQLYLQFFTHVHESLSKHLPSLSIPSPCPLPSWTVKIQRPLQKEQTAIESLFQTLRARYFQYTSQPIDIPKQSLPPEDSLLLSSFILFPLLPLPLLNPRARRGVIDHGGGGGVIEPLKGLPFKLADQGWPRVAREMVERMDKDVKEYAQLCIEEPNHQLDLSVNLGVFVQKIHNIIGVERGALTQRIRGLLELANSGGQGGRLRGICDDKVVFSLDMLIEILLAESPLTVLSLLNRDLERDLALVVREQTVMVCLASSRLALLGRVLVHANAALVLKSKQADEVEIKIQNERLVEELTTHRSYFFENPRTKTCSFDPRYLVMEVVNELVLRKKQVKLVQEFTTTKQSICHQMLMGSGKTTVVAPLLALMMSTPDRPVFFVVPAPLVEFSRTIMRQRFAAIIRKPVHTLKYDRGTRISRGFFNKLATARERSAVMLTSPSSVKSFFVKSVELPNVLKGLEDVLSSLSSPLSSPSSSPPPSSLFLAPLGITEASTPGQKKESPSQSPERTAAMRGHLQPLR